MTDCLFCRIADKEVNADIVRESDQVIAFRDINPAAPTHILIIPKEHIESARDLGPDRADVLAEIFTTIGALAEDEGLDRGFRVVTNAGGEAGQSVPHLHFHLLGGRSFSWPPG